MNKAKRNSWILQDAKNQFSTVVNAALSGQPQRVSRRGKPAVIVLDAAEYERLSRLDKRQHGSLAELLCAMPGDDGVFERRPMQSRDFTI